MVVVSVLGITFILFTYAIEGRVQFDMLDPRTDLLLVLPVTFAMGVWMFICPPHDRDD
jgi:hypothetical protein